MKSCLKVNHGEIFTLVLIINYGQRIQVLNIISSRLSVSIRVKPILTLMHPPHGDLLSQYFCLQNKFVQMLYNHIHFHTVAFAGKQTYQDVPPQLFNYIIKSLLGPIVYIKWETVCVVAAMHGRMDGSLLISVG